MSDTIRHAAEWLRYERSGRYGRDLAIERQQSGKATETRSGYRAAERR